VNYDALVQVAFLSMALAAVSITITKTGVFSSLRAWIDERNDWLGELIHCPYCTSHWLTFAVVAFYQPRPIESGVFLVDMVVSTFAIVCLTAWFGGLIYRAYAK